MTSPGSVTQVWWTNVTSLSLFLLTFFTVVQSSSVSRRFWRLHKEQVYDERRRTINFTDDLATQRRLSSFLAAALVSISRSSSPSSDQVSNSQFLFGAHHNDAVWQSLSAVDRPSSTINARDRLEAVAVKRLPRAIIVGVKKGGTRALLEYLNIHPDVHVARHEIHFFDKHYNNGLDWYRSQMPSTLPEQLTIEKTPSYFVTPGVAQRVHDMSRDHMSRDVRLLVVVRDPVSRALSDYAQSLSKRPQLNSFESLAFPSSCNWSVVDADWSPVRVGLYARYVRPWLDRFTPTRLFFVCGERLVTDPAGELASVERFLGLRPFINNRNFYFNATKGFPCVRLLSGRSHCLGESKGRRHPAVDERALQRLRTFYRPYNAVFYKLTGINFGWD